MKYFNTLPQIAVKGPDGNYTLATNLLARTSVIKSLSDDASLFYTYDIQEHDNPEIVADKYYGDSYRYWIVLLGNEILDPQWQWPLNNQQFNVYINDKYYTLAAAANNSVLSYMQTTIKYYRKIITTIDNTSHTQTVTNYNISQLDYTNLITSSTSVVLPSGSSSTVIIDKQMIDIYTWEVEQNEGRRSIKLFNENLAGSIEQQLQQLMNR